MNDLEKLTLDELNKRRINRLDFGIFDDKINVWLFDVNWQPSQKYPTDGAVAKPGEFDVDAFIESLEANGWTVFRWSAYGARAFKGQPWPVRSKYEIIETRKRLENDDRRGVHHPYNVDALDLAYEL